MLIIHAVGAFASVFQCVVDCCRLPQLQDCHTHLCADTTLVCFCAYLCALQVGDVARDRLYWGAPERSTIPRPATFLSAARPGTDAMAMAAAGLASAAVAIQDESLQVADVYLQKALTLYQLAQRWRGYYAKYVESGKIYPSVSMYDDLAYAAIWIYIATGDENYLNDAMVWYEQHLSSEGHVNPNPYMFNYENVVPALDLLLYQATKDSMYKKNVQDFVREWMNTKSKTGDVIYTTKNLAKAQPAGNLQHTANAAFYTMVAAKHVLDSKFMLYACWARNQVGYMLGDAGRSYVTGYGAVQPKKIPHKAGSCPPPDVTDCTWESAYYTTDPNYNDLRGGLVGGPDDNDNWADDRDMNNPANTVTLLNSAGFSAAMAALVDNDINMAKCQQGEWLRDSWLCTLFVVLLLCCWVRLAGCRMSQSTCVSVLIGILEPHLLTTP